MANVYLVLGFLGLVTGTMVIVEMVTNLILYWNYLCKNDDGNFYGDESWK